MLTKVFCSVNKQEKAFDAVSLGFRGQKFVGYDLSATRDSLNMNCYKLSAQTKPSTIKIKQRNTEEGVSKICGLQMLDSTDQMIISIDLCPGLGQWRIQKLATSEYIIGLHSYVVADDESSEPQISTK